MDAISSAVAGFSAVSAALLLCAYALMQAPGKSAYSVISCAVLLAALACIQISHLQYFTGGAQPLQLFYYRLALFVVPSSFYFFGRWAILPTESFRASNLLHLLPSCCCSYCLSRSRCRSCCCSAWDTRSDRKSVV
jgi:hypothetical protein